MCSHLCQCACRLSSLSPRAAARPPIPQVPELHVPLAGVFRAHGHTVIASAMAPLRGADTLVYGSCDALRSFVDRHTAVVTPIVEELGRKLGMCGCGGHNVGIL
jgi:hypothetical protein